MTDIECVVDAKALLGESTYWDPDDEVLWWIDIYGKTVHCYDPETSTDETITLPEYPGCLAVREIGGLVISDVNGFHFLDTATGKLEAIVDPEANEPDTRFNDGKTDRQGRFWSGSMFEAPGKPVRKVGALYRLDLDLTCHKVVDGVGCSNGLAWSPDSRTMYYTDSHGPVVWAFDFDAVSGEAENRRPYVDLSFMDGIVDGSTVDAEGCYWLTVPFKGKVMRFDPAGKLMRTIELPTDLPTCCEFGGPNLDILYVTTATLRRSAEALKDQPLAGGLFALDVGVKGLPLVPFRG
ncbi:gluconolaconase [Kaistia algarum]|uniref:SMP-30/gluconolactonase/LRE family protein n=1 Tax=Kaistia algarum TaxID=2083279 RepID=UPI000CE88237|nr:SMP-30/gluconolactonase/LRE family protein [Kaistia algarum]MCX5514274.1 SMP-30/gluconolactonase/LRE family protein [Kaistia algarum]PPE79032.1 gluconolaconase [Kaistia algarum]